MEPTVGLRTNVPRGFIRVARRELTRLNHDTNLGTEERLLKLSQEGYMFARGCMDTHGLLIPHLQRLCERVLVPTAQSHFKRYHTPVIADESRRPTIVIIGRPLECPSRVHGSRLAILQRHTTRTRH